MIYSTPEKELWGVEPLAALEEIIATFEKQEFIDYKRITITRSGEEIVTLICILTIN